MNSFYNITMGPLPKQTCAIFSIIGYLELITVIMCAILCIYLLFTGHYIALLPGGAILIVSIARYLQLRLLFNICIHKQ